jgi:hypothetical protein
MMSARENVLRQAINDARGFCEEFPGQTIQSSGDWDSAAYQESARELGLDQAERDALWPVYRDALHEAVQTMSANSPTDDEIRELCIITTRNEAGQHFTEWSNHYEALEAAGLIAIDRPSHHATGIPYACGEWSLEVTPEGQDVVDAHPELHPA